MTERAQDGTGAREAPFLIFKIGCYSLDWSHMPVDFPLHLFATQKRKWKRTFGYLRVEIKREGEDEREREGERKRGREREGEGERERERKRERVNGEPILGTRGHRTVPP